jgi:hypothetical protein
MNQLGNESDYVLANGARVDFKVRYDTSGGAAISELRVYFPRSIDIPAGGISANTLREIHIGELLRHWNARGYDAVLPQGNQLSKDDEDALLHALHNYPANLGRAETPPIFLASTAYFYAKLLRENPRTPNVKLSELLEIPIRTINTRVSKARAAGFLESGDRTKVGGRGRGYLTPMAVEVISRFLEGVNDEY